MDAIVNRIEAVKAKVEKAKSFTIDEHSSLISTVLELEAELNTLILNQIRTNSDIIAVINKKLTVK